MRKTILTAAACALALAAAGPATADAAFPCFGTFERPTTDAWKLHTDGTLQGALHAPGATAFEEGHGALRVNGQAYPTVTGDACARTATSTTYPWRMVGGVAVQRTVAKVGDQLRHVDAIMNTAPTSKSVTADFHLAVLGSQKLQTTESGNAEADRHDHWAVLGSNGLQFPFVRWGEDGALDPDVDPEVPGHLTWKPDVGGIMRDATLRYEQLFLAPGQTARLLHFSGATTSLATATAAVKKTATPFTGLTRAVASQVVNWGPDPDGDGVPKHLDDCPGEAGPGGCASKAP